MNPYESELAFEEEEDTQHGRFLTFGINKEIYGIEISVVTEIVGIQPITQLPEVPEHIRGIVNLRGRIIPVVDCRLRFGLPAEEYTDRTCIIVIDIEQYATGLIVDNVDEVLVIDDSNIVPPPETAKGVHHQFIRGIGKAKENVILLLDCKKLFEQDETILA
ncbi:MAG: chemotaxis protein CheW [Eubacteriales bacterium]